MSFNIRVCGGASLSQCIDAFITSGRYLALAGNGDQGVCQFQMNSARSAAKWQGSSEPTSDTNRLVPHPDIGGRLRILGL